MEATSTVFHIGPTVFSFFKLQMKKVTLNILSVEFVSMLLPSNKNSNSSKMATANFNFNLGITKIYLLSVPNLLFLLHVAPPP